nr:fucolectin-7-like [Biomphalaria glabrata]
MPPRMFCVLQMTSAVTCIVGLYNAALFKPAVQIDTYMTDEAYKAVDGNNDSNAFHGYCQITLQHKVPWWMVDLRGQFTVEQVRITNRQDDWVYGMRLQNFDIDVFEQDPRQLPNFPDISGHVCYHQTSAPGLGTFTYNCTAPIVGRYVRLVLR